jgi:hypothetical protein
MSRQIKLYENQTDFHGFVEEAANGAAIVIAKDGKPLTEAWSCQRWRGRTATQTGTVVRTCERGRLHLVVTR